MAKVTAPLLGFGARGQIGKTGVFGSWRGVQYARAYSVPANPKSTAQTTTRSTFSNLSAIWKQAPTLFQAPWTLYAKGQPLTDRNAFIKFNLPVLRGQADLAAMLGSPGAKGGLPPTSVSVDNATAGELTVDFTNPDAPTGWTLSSAIAAIIRNDDPETMTVYDVTAGEDTVTKNAVTFSSLTASDEYHCMAWLKWAKPDGSVAYSASLVADATVT